MPFRKQIEQLEFRRAIWLHVMQLLKTVHRHRLPGRRFGDDIELLMIYGAATVACFSRGKFAGSTDIARYLGMSRETVRRHLVRLIDLGLLERDGHKFRLSPSCVKTPDGVMPILLEQVATATKVAELGRIEVRKLVREATMEDSPEATFMDTPAMLWSSRPDGVILTLNPAWCANYSMTLDKARGKGWEAIIHQDDRGLLLDPWFRSLATGEPYDATARLRDRSGQYRWYRASGVPVLKDGKIVKWSGVNSFWSRPERGR
jgi:PAS domain S-box-containing protein